MKKVILGVTIIGIAFVAQSCLIKTKTCTCVESDGTSTSTNTIPVTGTKNQRKSVCASYEESYSSGTTTYTTTCNLD